MGDWEDDAAEALMVGDKSVVVEECGELVQVYLGPSHQRLADALLSAKAKGRREALDEPLVATAVRFAAAIAEHEECACPTTETTCVHFDRMADAEVAYCAARAGAIAVPPATGEARELAVAVITEHPWDMSKTRIDMNPTAEEVRAAIDPPATGEDGDLRARVLAFADLVERKRCRAWQPGEVAWRLRAWIDGDEAPEMRRGATGEDGDREEPHVFKRRNKK